MKPPEWLVSWADVIGHLAPLPIAIAAAVIAYSQWIIARSSLQLDLLDRRLAFQKSAIDVLSRAVDTDESELLVQLIALATESRRIYSNKIRRLLNASLIDCREACRLRERLNSGQFDDQKADILAGIVTQKSLISKRLDLLSRTMDEEARIR